MNNDVAAIGCLHHDTPDARVRPRFVAPVFGGDEPTAPRPQEKGFFDRLIKSRGERIDESNRAAQDRHDEALAVWREEKRIFERQVAKRRNLIETLICEDVEAMEAYVEESLQAIMWPRETLISLEVTQGGLRAMLDVDLPELEDMPKQVAQCRLEG